MAGVVNRVLRAKTPLQRDLPTSPSSSSPCHLPSVRSSLQHGFSGGLQSQNRAEGRCNLQRGKTVLMPVPENKWQPSLEEGKCNPFITYLHNLSQSIFKLFRPWRYCWVEALEILFEKVRYIHIY